MSESRLRCRGRRPVWAPLGLVCCTVLATLTANGAEAGDDLCDLGRLGQRLRQAGIAVQAVRPAGAAAAVLLGPNDGAPAAVVVFGFTANGELFTSQRLAPSAGAETSPSVPAIRSTILALEGLPELARCPGFAGGDPGHPDAREALDAAFRATAMPAQAQPQRPPAPAGPLLHRVVIALSLFSVFGYFGLLGFWSVRRIRRQPREALVGLCLFAVALLVRVLSAPRQPMQSGNGDLSVLFDVGRWLSEGIGGEVSLGYPPALRALLFGTFKVFGPSCDLAFWLMTLLGAATVVPVAGAVKRATGSTTAAVLAGLALAVYPPAIFFSNGVNLETLAGLLIALSFVHAQDVLHERRLLDALLYGGALALLVQSRPEMLPAAPVLVAAQGLMALERGGLRPLVRLWPAALFWVAALTPFLLRVLSASAEVDDRARSGMLGAVAAFAGVVLAVGALARLAERRFLKRLASARWVAAGVAAAMLLIVAAVVASFSANPFVSRPFFVPSVPYATFYTDAIRQWVWAGGGPGLASTGPFFMELGVFPLVFLVLGLLSWAPAPQPPRTGMLPLLAVPLALFGYELTHWISTGIAVADGFRYHVSFYPFLAMAVGVGALRVVQWLGGAGRWRLGATGAVGLLVVTPLATHAAFYTDTTHNAQREFAFVDEAVGRLPDEATVLVPDDLLDLRSIDAGLHAASYLYRAEHLLSGVAEMRGRRLQVFGLQAALRRGALLPGAVFFYRGLDCYRALAPATLSPSCHHVSALVGPAKPLAATRIANRVYSGAPPFLGLITPRLSVLEFAFVPLTPAELEALRHRYGFARPGAPAASAQGGPMR